MKNSSSRKSEKAGGGKPKIFAASKAQHEAMIQSKGAKNKAAMKATDAYLSMLKRNGWGAKQ